MKPLHYILAPNHMPVPCPDEASWRLWMMTSQEERQVAETVVCGVRISTAFLGIDHNWTSTGYPKLFETLVLGGDLHESRERYAFWDDAMAGHEQWVARVEGTMVGEYEWPTHLDI
jgi:hypothetical protein